MAELSWAETVRQVHERANRCCEYCQTCQDVCGQSMHVEHIDPTGGSKLENLCLACASCNLSKGQAVSALDPDTNQIMPLFHPRQQQWRDHFEWIDQGAQIHGLTAVGRATIERLRMNIERVVTSRRIWVRAGAHPPEIKVNKRT
jgi:hypothetical protein